MYRDSDGYILIDMGAADISKSTQSIVGFYDRIVESINANKLVLVINFGNYSPMPAIAHKKLNYYEIVTNLYKITINSNDIVIIEETGESTVDVSIVPTLQEGVKVADFAIGEVEGSIYAPEQVDVINDNVTAENTTWSSDKIDTELDKKADSSSLATVATSGSYADLTNKPTLAAVATSGSYDDLINKPTIPADLDDLSDVTLTSPANGQTLVYDSTSEQFVNATPPSGVTTLAALTDVSLTTPASGNSLVFDGTEWANDTLAASDIPYSQGVSVADKLDSLNNDLTITKIAISDFIQLASGVSVDGRSAVYKQGKHIWLNIYGSITGTFTPNTAMSIGTVKSGYVTENLITTICGIHNSMWGVSNIGYLFFNSNGDMQVSTVASNMNNFKISLDYCTA